MHKRNVVLISVVEVLLILAILPMPQEKDINNGNKRILFIHHSTGGNLIKEGALRHEISKLDHTIEFWDHNYNLFPVFTYLLAHKTHLKGLSDNNGKVTGLDYRISLSNNSPKEYAEIFSRDPTDPTLKAILDYDVIAFKNCYPTTRIVTEAQLQEDINYYKNIRDSIKKYPNKQFIILTPPPAREGTTNSANASRAKKLVNYLNSPEFLDGITNLHIFDFFNLLANENSVLKKEYLRPLFFDSHPNKAANEFISPIFARYLVEISKK